MVELYVMLLAAQASPIPAKASSPVPKAAPAAKAAARGPVPPDAPICCFCQDVMVAGGEPVEALWCSHSFHKFCLEEWRVCARKTSMDCPYRCQRSHGPLFLGE